MQPDRRLWAVSRARYLIQQALAGIQHEGGKVDDLPQVLDGLSEVEHTLKEQGANRAPYQPKRRGFLG